MNMNSMSSQDIFNMGNAAKDVSKTFSQRTEEVLATIAEQPQPQGQRESREFNFGDRSEKIIKDLIQQDWLTYRLLLGSGYKPSELTFELISLRYWIEKLKIIRRYK